MNKKVYSTWDSKAVAQPSTSQARRGLTSVIGREPVLSAWYGRRPINNVLKCIIKLIKLNKIKINMQYAILLLIILICLLHVGFVVFELFRQNLKALAP